MAPLFCFMRYFQEKPDFYLQTYGETYICDHPAYNRCTLFKDREIGLAIIQQRYDRKTKKTWWAEVEPWLVDRLYLHPGFYKYFIERAGTCTDGLYPTVTIRQIMWALRMKPLKKERWETVFDRRDI